MNRYLVLFDSQEEEFGGLSISGVINEYIVDAESPDDAVSKRVCNIMKYEYEGNYGDIEIDDFIKDLGFAHVLELAPGAIMKHRQNRLE